MNPRKNTFLVAPNLGLDREHLMSALGNEFNHWQFILTKTFSEVASCIRTSPPEIYLVGCHPTTPEERELFGLIRLKSKRSVIIVVGDGGNSSDRRFYAGCGARYFLDRSAGLRSLTSLLPHLRSSELSEAAR